MIRLRCRSGIRTFLGIRRCGLARKHLGDHGYRSGMTWVRRVR